MIWLPNVGFGTLPPTMETYLREGLSEATGSDKGRAILFYCLERCWMSWNAAKRALALGYRKVLWYPASTDGWRRTLRERQSGKRALSYRSGGHVP